MKIVKNVRLKLKKTAIIDRIVVRLAYLKLVH